MASFDLAIPVVLRREGGYVNDPKDPGGQTKFGISMRWLRANNLVDLVADDEGVSHDMVIKAMTVGEADKLYKQYWWDKYGFEGINDQAIATKLFDTAVNIGSKVAIKFAQACCGVPMDGVMGPQTLGALNNPAANATPFIPCYRGRQAIYYNNLVIFNPNLQKFLEGWINRAYDRI